MEEQYKLLKRREEQRWERRHGPFSTVVEAATLLARRSRLEICGEATRRTDIKPSKPLSTFCPTIPDLVDYLPDPSDALYPEQTLALILLLDQSPREIYTGVDGRYMYGFFDDVCRKLVKSLLSSGPSLTRLSGGSRSGIPSKIS